MAYRVTVEQMRAAWEGEKTSALRAIARVWREPENEVQTICLAAARAILRERRARRPSNSRQMSNRGETA